MDGSEVPLIDGAWLFAERKPLRRLDRDPDIASLASRRAVGA
jgi:hypothetical protein